MEGGISPVRRVNMDTNAEEETESLKLFQEILKEWEDNKEALLEYIWATHYGVKGMVSNDLHNQEHTILHLR